MNQSMNFCPLHPKFVANACNECQDWVPPVPEKTEDEHIDELIRECLGG